MKRLTVAAILYGLILLDPFIGLLFTGLWIVVGVALSATHTLSTKTETQPEPERVPVDPQTNDRRNDQ
jgi:hypothetical protein